MKQYLTEHDLDQTTNDFLLMGYRSQLTSEIHESLILDILNYKSLDLSEHLVIYGDVNNSLVNVFSRVSKFTYFDELLSNLTDLKEKTIVLLTKLPDIQYKDDLIELLKLSCSGKIVLIVKMNEEVELYQDVVRRFNNICSTRLHSRFKSMLAFNYGDAMYLDDDEILVRFKSKFDGDLVSVKSFRKTSISYF